MKFFEITFHDPEAKVITIAGPFEETLVFDYSNLDYTQAQQKTEWLLVTLNDALKAEDEIGYRC